MKRNYNFNWNMSLPEKEMTLWALSQYRQLAFYLAEKHNLKMADLFPDIGTDEGGSDLGFDWWMLLELESRKILDKYGVKREIDKSPRTEEKEK